MVKIVINKGHDKTDSGSSGNGLVERDVTKKIGDKVIQLLKQYDCQVKGIQDTLVNTTRQANNWKADVFISIHINAGGGTGFESYIYNGSVQKKTSQFQNTLHDEIMKSISKYKVSNRGKKKANFHVLRETHMTACLTENMFIDTKKDADLLKNNKFINDLAQGYVNGIVKFTGIKKKKPKKTSTNKGDTFYRVVAGSYKNRKNADDQVKKLKKLGIDVFIDVYKK